jgi:hypothetical protein
MGVRTAAQKTVTANGNAQIDTAQYKFGSASGLFDGNADYLSIPDSDDWYFGAGDFTIRFFVRFNVLPSSGQYHWLIHQRVDNSNNMYVSVRNESPYNLQLLANSGGTNVIECTQPLGSITTGVWYWIVITRSGNDFKMYLDGAQIGVTVTDTDAIPNYAADFTIGTYMADTTKGLNGWIDEFEIAKGVARAATVPSIPLIPDEYTVLLLHCEGADASTTFTDSINNITAQALTTTTVKCTTSMSRVASLFKTLTTTVNTSVTMANVRRYYKTLTSGIVSMGVTLTSVSRVILRFEKGMRMLKKVGSATISKVYGGGYEPTYYIKKINWKK